MKTAKMIQTGKGITLLGLGPGNPDLLTRQAWNILQAAPEIYLRTRMHPTVSAFPENLEIHSFDHLYEEGFQFEEVYAEIVNQVLALGERAGGVIYAVPGHPLVAETTAPEIARQARQRGIPVQIVEGLSFLEPVFSALGDDPFPQMSLVDAFELANGHHPLFPTDVPALICQIHSREMAANVKLTLMAVYPDEHPVRLVHAAGLSDEIVEDLPLYAIDRSQEIGLLTTLFVPPLGLQSSFESLMEIVAHLRAPEDGCPWDLEQTSASLRPHFLEEAYEALAAMDAADPDEMCEEFGDMLLMIAMQAQIASEEGDFTIGDVLQGINAKLIRRHPHVFGDVTLDGSVQGVITNWERLKAEEKKGEKAKKNGLLDGVPITLPALAQSQEYQERVARVGFDWPDVDGVYAKIAEEMGEVKNAKGQEARSRELGDLLFVLVRLVSWYGVSAEAVLREANMRFRNRFAYVEAAAKEQGRSLDSYSLDELNVFWDAAKRYVG